MDLVWFMLLLTLLLCNFDKMLAFDFVPPTERRCRYTRVNRLTTVRCNDMNLREVPHNLKASVEILDLSYNRIRKLKHNTFQRYTDVQFLILYDNMIQSIEPGTFSQLTSLQEIDFSNNALMTIPLELFELPKLRNLYVDSNDLQFLERDLMQLETPIKAPLEYLNIADCNLHDIPDLGILPYLWQVNASQNPLTNFNIDKLANLCHLKVIDLTKTQISQCTCQQINNHLSILGINKKFTPICLDMLSSAVCPLPYNQTIDSEPFKSCQQRLATAKKRDVWLFTAGIFGGVLLVLLVCLYGIYRYRKRRAKKKLCRIAQNRQNFVISPKNAINNNRRNDELLRCDTA